MNGVHPEPEEVPGPAAERGQAETVQDSPLEKPAVGSNTNIPVGSDGPAPVPISLQRLTDRTLQFLSTASNETIGACLVGLGATTYFVFGRVGLVLIGMVGGVALHATWEHGHTIAPEATSAEEKRRREVGVDVAKRVLDWRNERKEDGSESDVRLDFVGKELNFKNFRPETAAALQELTDAAIRDYVNYWYTPILPTENVFPAACRRIFTSFILAMAAHMSRKRPADTLIDFLANTSSILIVFLNELSAALAANPDEPTSEAINAYLDAKPDSSLAHVVDEKHQARKLDLVAEDILESFLDPKALNCDMVRIFLRETLAKCGLEWTIQACSKPEFINGWIVYLLEEGETELMKEIDAGVEQMTGGIAGSNGHASDVKEEEAKARSNHKRVVSRAQEAMDEAIKEAARLSQMIAEEDARRALGQDIEGKPNSTPNYSPIEQPAEPTVSTAATSTGDTTEVHTPGADTPTSSQIDLRQSDEIAESQPSSSPEQATMKTSSPSPFTSFDQIIPRHQPTALADPPKKEPEIFTLYKANITLMDDSDPNDRTSIRNKPTTEYLVQIEPASSQYPGWMIVRRFPDFEVLHDTLSKIAKVTDASSFSVAHQTLPHWKGLTKHRLKEALERYLVDAMQHRSLADTGPMKRFLEKDQAVSKAPNKQGRGFPSALGDVGKGVIDVFAKAPKEVASGGKAFVGGVTGVLGAKGRASATSSPKPASRTNTAVSASSGTPSRLENSTSSLGLSPAARISQDSLRAAAPVIDTQPSPVPQMERRPSSRMEQADDDAKSRASVTPSTSMNWSDQAPIFGGDQIISLPPPPSDIPDNYETKPSLPTRTCTAEADSTPRPEPRSRPKPARTNTMGSNTPDSPLRSNEKKSESPAGNGTRKKHPPAAPLTEQETQVAIELLFATITELFGLSSAWTFRLTLLTAAKSLLLRPGNAQLTSIRDLLQTSALDANSSDVGVATHVHKMRMNALPTEEERAAWPAEMSPDEKEELRRRARRVFVERGMPQALTSVMGMQACREAMGRVFDCLQVGRVARGLVFSLILQAVRGVTQ